MTTPKLTQVRPSRHHGGIAPVALPLPAKWIVVVIVVLANVYPVLEVSLRISR